MIERLQQRRQEEGGFTLVELLVVIVILGILAAIVVFAVGGITNKGSDAANSTDISVIQAAQEAAFAQDTATTPKYLTETGLISGKYLRSKSTKSLLCLNDAATDYYVFSTTIPADQTAANTACNAAGNLSAAGKSGTGWVGSAGITAIP